jgi:hypothetical protein
MSGRSVRVFLPPAVCSCLLTYRGVTHSGRTVTARKRGVGRGASASRPAQTSGCRRLELGAGGGIGIACWTAPAACLLRSLARVPGIGLLNRTSKSRAEWREVQLLRGLPSVRNDEG